MQFPVLGEFMVGIVFPLIFKSSVTRLKPENTKMKITGIQEKWRGVEHKYEMYYLEVSSSISVRTSWQFSTGSQISKLQDFYPSLYLRSKPEFYRGLKVEPSLLRSDIQRLNVTSPSIL
jgi:hypothetical protein